MYLVQYNMTWHTVLQWLRQTMNESFNSQKHPVSQNFVSVKYTNLHNRHPISRPYGRAMGCLLWGFISIYQYFFYLLPCRHFAQGSGLCSHCVVVIMLYAICVILGGVVAGPRCIYICIGDNTRRHGIFFLFIARWNTVHNCVLEIRHKSNHWDISATASMRLFKNYLFAVIFEYARRRAGYSMKFHHVLYKWFNFFHPVVHSTHPVVTCSMYGLFVFIVPFIYHHAISAVVTDLTMPHYSLGTNLCPDINASYKHKVISQIHHAVKQICSSNCKKKIQNVLTVVGQTFILENCPRSVVCCRKIFLDI